MAAAFSPDRDLRRAPSPPQPRAVKLGRVSLYHPRPILARLRRAITTVPKPGDWAEALLGAALLGAVFGPLGFATGLLHWEPRPAAVVLKCALVVFFVPALGEELTFRGALIPDRTETPRARTAILASTAVFTLWHMVETLWLPGERTTFLRTDFLAWAAALGLVCAVLRRRSGSIWPPVVLHWAVVVAWTGWLGGRPLV
jgi:CAAX protease family protein